MPRRIEPVLVFTTTLKGVIFIRQLGSGWNNDDTIALRSTQIDPLIKNLIKAKKKIMARNMSEKKK